jgi:hypothetical protein
MRSNGVRNKVVAVVALGTAILISAGSCSGEDDSSSQERESESRGLSYDAQVANQPAQRMEYSPTRDTINFWINTWDEPDKVSFVYLQNANGDLIGYYVMKGLPVNMCAALTPTYELKNVDAVGGSQDIMVPAPSVDGVYYSGGQCMTYYGRDATTDTYLEFTAGLGINVLLYEEPLPRSVDVQPLGPTTASEVQ